MNLIDEVEISYFRSFYKFKFRNLSDLNIIFGKNDSGKSNIVRALNLFFSGSPESGHDFEFPIDFSDQRASEADESEDVRKFLYVKITFNTPVNYQRSLGEKFYVKRQWTVSRGADYNEEISNSIPSNRRHIVARFLNRISFIYIPAIKSTNIFEMLLGRIHECVAASQDFDNAVSEFAQNIQNLTGEMFEALPTEVSGATRIGAPNRLDHLFQTLDFETFSDVGGKPKSLTRQRGDGVKARHIPDLLSFISEKDNFEYHIWGFEEPENSLDFVAAESEAQRFLDIAKNNKIQVFMTTHSPAFYMLEGEAVTKTYISKEADGRSKSLQGKSLADFDPQQAIGEGFYLPAVADALKDLMQAQQRAASAEGQVDQLRQELAEIAMPVVLTEGRTDAIILEEAWARCREGDIPFSIRSCETGGENPGAGNGGAERLAIRLKAVSSDHPHTVIGVFDFDEAGIKASKLDRNFVDTQIRGAPVRRSMHGRSYAMCLPAPEFREECRDCENLPIEFLFRDQDLEHSVGGARLELRRKEASRRVGNKTVKFELDDFTHFKDIAAGKSEFANVVVPDLPDDAFAGFDAVFALIEEIVRYDQAREAVADAG